MKKIKKFLGVSIPEKWLGVLAVFLLVVMLLPILRLAMYAMPWYDDYSYAINVKNFIKEYGPLKGAIDGALYVARTWWYCWQGTFSSIFMMSLMPEVFGEGLYYVGILGIIIFFTFSSMFFVKTVCKEFLKAGHSIQFAVAALVTLTMIELIYTAQQGIYWYNSAVHYTFMHGCMFLLLTFVIKVLCGKTKPGVILSTVFAVLLAVVCGGSNFVTALQGMLLMLLATAVGFWGNRKRSFLLLPVDIVYGIALYMNLSAPGNEIRGARFNGCGPIESVLLSFKAGAVHFWEFTGSITIIILIAFVLIIWNSVSRLHYSFRYPLVITVLSFCFYCTGFTSSYYGMGGDGLARTWVVVKFTLQLLLFFNVAYWLGWWMHRRKEAGKTVPQVKQWLLMYVLVGGAAVLWLVFSSNQAGTCATWGAYFYVHIGEANNLYNEYLERVETITESDEPIVGVKAYQWKPWFLYKGELSIHMDYDTNNAMTQWYGKDGIYIVE